MTPVQTAVRVKKGAGILVQPYTEEWIGQVAAFNRRLTPANPPFQLPETPAPDWLPKSAGQKVYQELFLAVEQDCVRGAYTFKHQEFCIGGRVIGVGMCRMPISEGIVDKRYAAVGAQLVNDAVRRQPLLYALGIGSLNSVMTRLLLAMGWSLSQIVPFFFKVRNGSRFSKEIRYLRTSLPRRLLLDAAAHSGIGYAAARLADTLLTRNGRNTVYAEQVDDFSGWADPIWEECQSRYSMVAIRDASSLNMLYPAEDRRFLRLKILDGCRTIGWAVLLDTVMSENQYFGNMRVGSLVDCLAAPEHAPAIIAAATRFLDKRGVELMLSNQSHPAWRRGLKKSGFMAGPSNFYFVTSRRLTSLLSSVDPVAAGFHLNRGDGDGPIHL